MVVSGNSNVTGTIIFEQSSSRGAVFVRGELQGLDPNALRGFHVQYAQDVSPPTLADLRCLFSQFGDLTKGCLSAGPHFNPFKANHGAPTAKVRHVGDLGNIKTNGNGEAIFTFTDSQLSLNGPFSIVG